MVPGFSCLLFLDLYEKLFSCLCSFCILMVFMELCMVPSIICLLLLGFI